MLQEIFIKKEKKKQHLQMEIAKQDNGGGKLKEIAKY